MEGAVREEQNNFEDGHWFHLSFRLLAARGTEKTEPTSCKLS